MTFMPRGRVKLTTLMKTSNPVALRIRYPKYSPCRSRAVTVNCSMIVGDRLFTRLHPEPTIGTGIRRQISSAWCKSYAWYPVKATTPGPTAVARAHASVDRLGGPMYSSLPCLETDTKSEPRQLLWPPPFSFSWLECGCARPVRKMRLNPANGNFGQWGQRSRSRRRDHSFPLRYGGVPRA